MKNALSAHSVGLAFGGILGLWHFMWAVLVATELAQPLFSWILALHMIALPVTILPFSLATAFTLVVVTSLIGYAVGYVFATIWNMVMEKKS